MADMTPDALRALIRGMGLQHWSHQPELLAAADAWEADDRLWHDIVDGLEKRLEAAEDDARNYWTRMTELEQRLAAAENDCATLRLQLRNAQLDAALLFGVIAEWNKVASEEPDISNKAAYENWSARLTTAENALGHAALAAKEQKP